LNVNFDFQKKILTFECECE